MAHMDTREATAHLSEDHEQTLGRLAAIKAVTRLLASGDAVATLDALTDLKRLAEELEDGLDLHLMQEELALYPVLEPVISSKGGPVQVMLNEHEQIRQGVRALCQSTTVLLEQASRLHESGEWALFEAEILRVSAQAQALADFFATHIYKEERIMFPMANQFVRDRQLTRAANLMRSIKAAGTAIQEQA